MKRVAFALKWATRCCSLFPPSSTLRIDEFDAFTRSGVESERPALGQASEEIHLEYRTLAASNKACPSIAVCAAQHNSSYAESLGILCRGKVSSAAATK